MIPTNREPATDELAENETAERQPLTTDLLIEERVSSLVGRALTRQVWVMFLDENERQLPLLMPVSDAPVSPSSLDVENWARFIATTTEVVGARSVLVVIERYGSDRLTEADRSWARLARDGCSVAGVTLGAVLLSHRRGVRLLPPDEYADG